MALTTPPPRRLGRGAPLWIHILGLLLVPLMGVCALSVTSVHTGWAASASAARSEQAVKAVSALDTARSDVDQEVFLVLSHAVLNNPAVSKSMGLDTAQIRALGQGLGTDLRRAQSATDLALVPDVAEDAGVLGRARATLTQLRMRASEPSLSIEGMQKVYDGYLAVADELTTAQRDAAQQARDQDASVATLRAVHDVQLITAVTQGSSREVPLFINARLASSSPADQAALSNARLALAHAVAGMDGLSSPSLRRGWHRAGSSPAMRAMDAMMDASLAGTPLTSEQQVQVLTVSTARERALSTLLDAAVGGAHRAAAADRRAADANRTWTLAVAVAVILASGLVALLIGLPSMRSMRLLAREARKISEGELVDVSIGGPRELRTVSTALGSAVDSLRRVQNQARAVSQGDLSNALLDESLPGPLGEVVHASVQQIVASVRAREELQSALAHQAAHDPLTELPNRSQALQLTSRALSRAQRSGAMTGLLFIDLDGFKAVNDSSGHACGDEVLREVAHRLQAGVRSGDVVCRLGGDEFVVLVEPVDSERDLIDLAERLISAVSAPIDAQSGAGTHHVSVGASIGIAISQDAGVDADALFAQADAAVYRAKDHGRGRAELFDESLRAALAWRTEMEEAISAGLALGEMHLRYQPVMDVATGHLHSYEALIRWDRPGHDTISPDDFIPIAEQSRLICDLDRWVLHEATRQLQEWRTQTPAGEGDPAEPTIAVNISGRHLTDPRVVANVTDALASSGLPPALLILEVTETVLVDDPASLDHLTTLRAMGVRTAIDDFGTGYTSIGQLGHLPMDILKIDRSFIASEDPAHRSLVTLMIRAAHTFGLTVVAEGVEEHAQLDRLKADSCDHVQGVLLRQAAEADRRPDVQVPARHRTARLIHHPRSPASSSRCPVDHGVVGVTADS